ncbi:hypothetical protein [Gordonia sihwensis]|uniref:hypothetical protein n=1 Tax=Gordonia sihwensis TaxID=173559 RepID=UPI003D960376
MAGLDLSTDGSGWSGTFGLTVEFMVTDLLRDGPIPDVAVESEREGLIRGELSSITTAEDGNAAALRVAGTDIEIPDNITRIVVE